MPLARPIEERTFDSNSAVLASCTFERVCAELGLNPQGPAAEVIANKIAELVQCGVKTPTELYLGTMHAFNVMGRE
jgi:hypothetical protein